LVGKYNIKADIIRKTLVIGLFILFIEVSIISGISKNIEKTSGIINTDSGPTFNNPDDDWDYWSNPPNMFSNISGYIGLGTSNPTNKLTIVGSDTVPLLNIEQRGDARGMRVNTTSKCAIWVEHAGNHGLRITQADGNGVLVTNANQDGIHVEAAGIWAGYFNGKGYFAQNVL